MILDLRFAGGDDGAVDAAVENFPAKKCRWSFCERPDANGERLPAHCACNRRGKIWELQ